MKIIIEYWVGNIEGRSRAGTYRLPGYHPYCAVSYQYPHQKHTVVGVRLPNITPLHTRIPPNMSISVGGIKGSSSFSQNKGLTKITLSGSHFDSSLEITHLYSCGVPD
ncbi:hypothetical protein TNCV_3878001 [Trichonephila clavipes]|uniref:Uncharacterized protein n=1 Tax=Trichonephila clavipes TaxID=2585209 RepID=A0A8X6SSD2_TRICX|nr:hypothetical protein TNCV_3878001 [Trichonephila clavipes]